ETGPASFYIGAMRLVALLLLPTLLNGQTPPATSAPAAPAPVAAPVRPVYRGFGLAVPYSEFTARARALAVPGAPPLVCNTSRRTLQSGDLPHPLRRDFGCTIAGTEQGAGERRVAAAVAAGLCQVDQRVLHRAVVRRKPERDLHTMHDVAGLLSGANREVLLTL